MIPTRSPKFTVELLTSQTTSTDSKSFCTSRSKSPQENMRTPFLLQAYTHNLTVVSAYMTGVCNIPSYKCPHYKQRTSAIRKSRPAVRSMLKSEISTFTADNNNEIARMYTHLYN